MNSFEEYGLFELVTQFSGELTVKYWKSLTVLLSNEIITMSVDFEFFHINTF